MRVMPDDNSCLFRAFAAAVLPGDDLSMLELRSLVASQIQEEPDVYTKVVLDNREPDDYCRWIQTEDAWGGAIELAILSKHFNVEVCSIDVQVSSPHPPLQGPEAILTTRRSLSASTASTKAPPSAASSSTQASTTTPSCNPPPTRLTLSPTTRPS